MTTEKHPNFDAAGTSLWESLTTDFDFDPRELALLAHACRQTDDVARLEAALERDGLIVTGSTGQPRLSAVVSELRQSRLAAAKLLADLNLPDDVVPRQSRRASKAAKARWGSNSGTA